MIKLYIVRHYIQAKTAKEAVKLSKLREPDDVYIADEWFQKVGFLTTKDKNVKGF